jgi:hypothetical protein
MSLSKEICPKRKYTIFANPFGGQGKAIKVWDQVKHIFGKKL